MGKIQLCVKMDNRENSPVHEACCGQQRIPHNQHKDNRSSERKEHKYNGRIKLDLSQKTLQLQSHLQLQLQN